jgi:tellurite resistance protein TerC
MSEQALLWLILGALMAVMMVLDLGVFHRKSHAVGLREALAWTAVWVGLAMAFMVLVYFRRGSHSAMEFLTAYLVEESLSVDNLFVFLMIFSYFRVPSQYQHRVLFWGILGAIVMRAAFIVTGIALLERFHWVIYVFGAFLVFTGVKMAFHKEAEIHPEKNLVLRLFRRLMMVTHRYWDGAFFLRRRGRTIATPLFVALLLVETSDVIFAVDSVPAVLAISHDPFIVYSSNLFAIMGLRSLYFALAGVMGLFHHLHYGLSFILAFIGVKMLAADFLHIPILASLAVIAATLALSIVASLLWPLKEKEPKKPAGEVKF